MVSRHVTSVGSRGPLGGGYALPLPLGRVPVRVTVPVRARVWVVPLTLT